VPAVGQPLAVLEPLRLLASASFVPLYGKHGFPAQKT